MEATLNRNNGLNDIQISLLKLFNRPISQTQTLELKRVMVRHFSKQLKSELGKIVKEKSYSQQDFDKMLNQPS